MKKVFFIISGIIFVFAALLVFKTEVRAQCSSAKGEKWCDICQECIGPENAPKTCSTQWCYGDEPAPCSCTAPVLAVTITSPTAGQSELDPDKLTVSWKLDNLINNRGNPRPISWGIDSGDEPNCKNNTNNDRFRIYYRKVSGSSIDVPSSPPPFTRKVSGWYRLDLPRTTFSYDLYNLDGASAYEIYVGAYNGCRERVSATLTFATALRPQPEPPAKQGPWVLTYGSNTYVKSLAQLVPSVNIDSILTDGNKNLIYKTTGQAFVSTYTLGSGGNVIPSRSSMSSFVNINYNDLNIKPPAKSGKESYYDYLLEIVQSNVTLKTITPSAFTGKTTTASAAAVAVNSTVHLMINGDTTIQDSTTPKQFFCNTKSIIFINGNLSIDPDFLIQGNDNGCMFIVKGNIRITTGDFKNSGNNNSAALTRYDTVSAFFINDGTFTTYTDAVGTAKWDGIVIWGGVISKDPLLLRDLDEDNNLTQPSEALIFDPRYITQSIFRDALSIKDFSIREEGFGR